MARGRLGPQTRETHKETWQAVPAEAPGQNSEASRGTGWIRPKRKQDWRFLPDLDICKH
jgi:hypothetical protein